MTMPGSTAEIDVIIVNWNSGELVARCIRALDDIASAAPSLNVIVVDNASSDGSDRIEPPRHFPLTVIRNQENIGFAAACNQGVAAGSADVVLLLNPDVKVGSVDALRRPLDFLRSPAGKDIAACGIQLRGEDGSVSQTRSRFPTPVRVFGWMTGLDRILPWLFQPQFLPVKAHSSSGPVDVVMGAFFMVRREVYEELKGLSSRFFVYYEDVDFCRRALNRGLKSWFLADVHAVHLGQGTTRNIKATRYFYCTRSRVIYGMRHFSRMSAWVIGWGLLTIEPIVRVLYSLLSLKPAFGIETMHGARRLWADAPHFMHSETSPEDKDS
jgi:GT2 family glycosyltransferase